MEAQAAEEVSGLHAEWVAAAAVPGEQQDLWLAKGGVRKRKRSSSRRRMLLGQ